MKWILFVVVLVVLFSVCFMDDYIYVEIIIDYGIMKVMLYNIIFKYWDNFIKLVKEGYYDGFLFYWVINGFMI